MIFIEEQRKAVVEPKPEVLILYESQFEGIAVIVGKLLIEKFYERGR